MVTNDVIGKCIHVHDENSSIELRVYEVNNGKVPYSYYSDKQLICGSTSIKDFDLYLEDNLPNIVILGDIDTSLGEL